MRFHLGAEGELQEVQRYYEDKQPGLGDKWLDVVEEAVRKLQKKPGSGRLARFGTRKCRLERFPYYVIFVSRAAELFIVSLMHVKPNSNYLAARL